MFVLRSNWLTKKKALLNCSAFLLRILITHSNPSVRARNVSDDALGEAHTLVGNA